MTKTFTELSDEDLQQTSLDDLRSAYQALRDHHVAETTALIYRRDDLTRYRDDQLGKTQQVLAESQKLIERADAIMTSDEETIDRLGSENASLVEIVDYMTNHYSPLGGRGCALCVYDNGTFIRPCALHRWEDVTAKVFASRSANSEDPAFEAHLSESEMAAWMASTGLDDADLEGTSLRAVLDELRERRDAELLFVEVDRQLQDVIDCVACGDGGPDGCAEHHGLIWQWRNARSAICELARLHRGYLLCLNAPGGGDPQ